MRNNRNGVTLGWLGFWELRVKPEGDYRPRKHGNTKHGRHSKARRESAAKWRLLIAATRGRYLPGLENCLHEQVPGWRLYPRVRNLAPRLAT